MGEEFTESEKDIHWLYQQPELGIITEDEEDVFIARVWYGMSSMSEKDARKWALEQIKLDRLNHE